MNGSRNERTRKRTRATTLALSVTAAAAAATVGFTALSGNGGTHEASTGNDASTGNTARAGHDAHAGHGTSAAPRALDARTGTADDNSGTTEARSDSADTTSTAPTTFAGSLNGANEVPTPGGPAVGDPDGRAVAVMRVQGNTVTFVFSFRGIGAPTAGHLHEGVKGQNGPIRIPFFTNPAPQGRLTVSGKVTVTDQQLLADLRTNPERFYFNLHTAQFPGGAVRGQVHKLSGGADAGRMPTATQASVLQGAQVYKCVRQENGTFAFTQDNVRARLEGRIAHFFAKPGPQGPPAWVAPDRSAVTGKVLTRTPNGEGNIPELDLAATQAGKPGGRLSRTAEILRLNTRGGVAPAGTCDPAKRLRVAVPYRADYLFINP